MKRGLIIFSLFLIIGNQCKPTIEKTNYPMIASLFNTLTAGLSVTYPNNNNLFFPVNQFSSISPFVTGTINSCTTDLALPSGLAISNTTCAISGTPTTNVSPTGYVVTVSDSETTITINLIITVSGPPAALAYGGDLNLTTGVDSGGFAPTVSGIVFSYSITPPLPAGLIFDTQFGDIYGIPIEVRATTSYTITAFNPAGFTQTSLNITVAPP